MKHNLGENLMVTRRKPMIYRLGFSLIELLVVISIIGILLALSAFGLQNSRSVARDARRKADIEQIRSALELYKADCGDYPAPAQVVSGTPIIGDGSPTACSALNIYLTSVPDDPLTGRDYTYGSSPTTYELCASLETGSGTLTCGVSSDCGAGIPCNYKKKNP